MEKVNSMEERPEIIDETVTINKMIPPVPYHFKVFETINSAVALFYIKIIWAGPRPSLGAA